MAAVSTYFTECIRYFIPMQAGRKDIFQFFQKIFPDFSEKSEGTEKKAQEPRQKIGQAVAEAQDKGAEQAEIQDAPQKEGQGQVEAHPTALGRLGVQKEQDRGPRPEQQVQGDGQPPGGDAAAQDAEQIVAQADPQPQQDAGGQGQGLGLHRERHGRNSRLNQPPCRLSSS